MLFNCVTELLLGPLWIEPNSLGYSNNMPKSIMISFQMGILTSRSLVLMLENKYNNYYIMSG